ncbi:MAG: hypothetical protein IKT88_02050 [Lachnospiraceae bacterium]|nr:hypothetical protein [Lachnospiraceae bacterium]
MSYCVHCGVELDVTASACPLCHTKVYNPNQPVATDVPPPYATKKGFTEPVKRKEFTIMVSIFFTVTSLVCLGLNLFTIQIGHWSYYVAGICAMLWVFLIPLFFPQKSNVYLHLLLNGIAIALFLGIISYLHPNNHWYEDIALPSVALGTILLEIIFFFAIHLKSSMLTKTIISVAAIAIFCIVLEIVIDLHMMDCISLRWSIIVAACSVVIDIVLITIRLLDGLRSEIRRRMHF